MRHDPQRIEKGMQQMNCPFSPVGRFLQPRYERFGATTLVVALLFSPMTFSAEPGGTKELIPMAYESLESNLVSFRPEIRPEPKTAPHRTWASLIATMPFGGRMVIELPEYMNAQEKGLALGQHESALVSGRKAIKSRTSVAQEPAWQQVGDELVLNVSTEQDLRVQYRVHSATGRIEITSTVENLWKDTLRRVNEYVCCAPSRDSAFYSTDVLTTRFLLNGELCSWDRIVDMETLHRPGGTENQTVQWLEAPVQGSGRILNPHPRRAVVRDEVDTGMIVQAHQTDSNAYMVLMAEPAVSIFKNCAGGCIHANPAHGDIAPGESHKARLVILFLQGGNVLERITETFGHKGAQSPSADGQ
jgi:hypothetical protein